MKSLTNLKKRIESTLLFTLMMSYATSGISKRELKEYLHAAFKRFEKHLRISKRELKADPGRTAGLLSTVNLKKRIERLGIG